MTNGKSKKMEVTPSRTAQHCAQCTAHGRISLLKGHKKLCPFKDCRCVHCVLVNNKRQIMAKQVKLKRLQEKNHARRRRREESNASLCCETVASLPEKKLVYLDGPEIGEIQHYQEEAWKAICGQNGDPESPFQDQVPSKCMTSEQWCPVSSLQYAPSGPLQQLQNPVNSVVFQPCYPVNSSATLNLFTTPVGGSEVLPISHALSQPILCQFVQPGYGQNTVHSNQFSSFSDETYLQPLEVVSFVGNGNMQMDAAQTLLTLRTGEE